MSKLNDLDNELVTIPHDAKAIAKAWGDKIRQLANNSQVINIYCLGKLH